MRKTLSIMVLITLQVALSVVVAESENSPADSVATEAPGSAIRFSIQTPQQNVTWEEIATAWKEAEALGFDSAWVYDHFIPIFGSTDRPCLEGWSLLSALATQTRRLRMGVLVTGNTYRNPVLLAKMATTVDHISGGRLILGIGAAWFETEHQAYGFPFYTAKERADRLSEALQVITKVWTEDHPTFRGTYYVLSRAPFAPLPVQKPHPPIVIGGQGKKWIVPLAARYGDGWNAVSGVSPQGIAERVQIIQAECRRIGREPCNVEVSALLPLVSITNIPLAGPAVRLGARAVVKGNVARSILAGSADDVRGQIQEYLDAGVTHIILSLRPPFNVELVRRFAHEVMPAFRADRQ